jgi:hypothetical protein
VGLHHRRNSDLVSEYPLEPMARYIQFANLHIAYDRTGQQSAAKSNQQHATWLRLPAELCQDYQSESRGHGWSGCDWQCHRSTQCECKRQAHGFNTMGWVDVLCGGRDFITNTYATTPDGIRPFTGFLHGKEDHTEYDLSKPNEPYFVRLDHIVELAAKHNILIFIDPIETAGWLQTLRNNGLKAATAYGEYLGNRYKKYPNVAWLNGNDFHGWQKESDDALVRAVAKGIKSVDPGHIQTVEFDPPFGSSLEDPSWAAIIAINGAYVYGPTYLQVLHNYNQIPVMPVFLMEAHYELEDVGHTPDFGTPLVLRREEYWAMLSGAKGQFYGNKYTWSFKDGWQNNIDTPGATQVTIWKDFFSTLP